MALVGDRDRDAAADVVRTAYVHGYLDDRELSERLGAALAARTPWELGASVRGLPRGGWLVLSAGLRPLLSAGAVPLRRRASRLLRRMALALFAAASVLVLLALGLWTLASGISAEVALGSALVWLALSAPPVLLWRSARRLGGRDRGS
jgi:hypothetical protein